MLLTTYKSVLRWPISLLRPSAGPFIIHVEQAIDDYFDTPDAAAPTPDSHDGALQRAHAVLAAYAALALSSVDQTNEGLARVIADILNLAATNGADNANIAEILNLARKQFRAEHAASSIAAQPPTQ